LFVIFFGTKPGHHAVTSFTKPGPAILTWPISFAPCLLISIIKTQSDDSCHLYSSIVPSIHFVPFNVINSKRNWAKFGVGVKLIVILRHIVAYFSINIRWHSQNVSSDSCQWLIKHLFPSSSCKKQINKQNSYLLLAFFQYGSVPELDMHESKHCLPGQFVHSAYVSLRQWLRNAYSLIVMDTKFTQVSIQALIYLRS
jgi:hypothetical protein